MILFTGIHGITIHFIMIHSTIHRGTPHIPGTGVGATVGTVLTIAGDGAIHLTTATGTVPITEDIMVGVIPITDGMDMVACTMLIRKITDTEKEPKVIPMYIMAATEEGVPQHQQPELRLLLPKVAALFQESQALLVRQTAEALPQVL